MNESLNAPTDERAILYFVGKEKGISWGVVDTVGNTVDTVGNTVDTDVHSVNRERKLANFLLGAINESELSDSDSFFGNKEDLIQTLKNNLADYKTINA